MKRLLFPIYTILILMFIACSTKVVPKPETDAKAIVPEYVINARERLGTEERESQTKLLAPERISLVFYDVLPFRVP